MNIKIKFWTFKNSTYFKQSCLITDINNQRMIYSKSPQGLHFFKFFMIMLFLDRPWGLKIKVGGVLKNSGNFQSNEHRNFVFSSKND